MTDPEKKIVDYSRALRIKVVESANDWCKNIITLATGTMVLSAIFIRGVFRELWMLRG